MPDGFLTYLYVNPTTHLIERQRDVRAIHPDLDSTSKWVETRFMDFRRMDGITRSFQDQQIDLRTGAVLATSTITSVEINVPIDSTVFSRPR
jgi:hypothetical protein